MTPELVIFDCDGVLVDSERIAMAVNRDVLRELGIPMSEPEFVERFVGRSAEVFATTIEEHLGHPLPRGVWERNRDMRRAAFRAELRAVEGVERALGQIRAAKCVASSSSAESVSNKLAIAGLAGPFGDNVFSATDVTHGKPAPDLFLHAAKQMGVHPSRCVVVEDSLVGVLAARAAEMRVCAYAGGLTGAEVLAGPGTTVFREMTELPELLRCLM